VSGSFATPTASGLSVLIYYYHYYYYHYYHYYHYQARWKSCNKRDDVPYEGHGLTWVSAGIMPGVHSPMELTFT
jgi:hypothetical protein